MSDLVTKTTKTGNSKGPHKTYLMWSENEPFYHVIAKLRATGVDLKASVEKMIARAIEDAGSKK